MQIKTLRNIIFEYFSGLIISILFLILIELINLLNMVLKFADSPEAVFLIGFFIGFPIGSVIGILVIYKFVEKAKDWNILGIILSIILGFWSCFHWIFNLLKSKEGNPILFILILLLISVFFSVFGFNLVIILKKLAKIIKTKTTFDIEFKSEFPFGKIIKKS